MVLLVLVLDASLSLSGALPIAGAGGDVGGSRPLVTWTSSYGDAAMDPWLPIEDGGDGD